MLGAKRPSLRSLNASWHSRLPHTRLTCPPSSNGPSPIFLNVSSTTLMSFTFPLTSRTHPPSKPLLLLKPLPQIKGLAAMTQNELSYMIEISEGFGGKVRIGEERKTIKECEERTA